MKKCSKCGVEKDESEFYYNCRMEDGLDYYCKECRKSQSVKFHKDNNYEYISHTVSSNLRLVERLKTPCRKCGENRMYLIQFHHIDPSTKKFMLSNCSARSKRSIIQEAHKCICLCSNCHNEFHHFYGKRPDKPLAAIREYLNDT